MIIINHQENPNKRSGINSAAANHSIFGDIRELTDTNSSQNPASRTHED